jgi:hypothetical protein
MIGKSNRSLIHILIRITKVMVSDPVSRVIRKDLVQSLQIIFYLFSIPRVKGKLQLRIGGYNSQS